MFSYLCIIHKLSIWLYLNLYTIVQNYDAKRMLFLNALLKDKMGELVTKSESDKLYEEIKQLLISARRNTISVVNTALVQTYWQVGKMIVEAQGGEERAKYGDFLLDELSGRLTNEFGKGFTVTNLKYMRQFYIAFPNRHAVRDQLSWTHYRQIIKVSNPKAREYYAKEAAEGNWSTRELERQIATQHYERLLSTHRDENELKELAVKNLPSKPETFDPLTLVHDPFILEFLDLKPDSALQESELESAILSHIEQFLLELGRGFAFMGRQKRITIDGQNFYPDLVFYNIITRSYVIIDLKMNRVDYSDIGQMQLYVNYYNMEICRPGENPTIGIILCSEKNEAVVKYTLGDRKDIGVFSSEYKLIMPTEEELKHEIEITRKNFKLLNS